MGTLHEGVNTIMTESRSVVLRMKNISHKGCKDKTYILCFIAFFENRAIYEIMWKNMVKPDKPQMSIRRTRFAYWINKATDTSSEYVAFTAQCYVHKYISFLVTLFFNASIFLMASPNN
jgi:hypothetical protein